MSPSPSPPVGDSSSSPPPPTTSTLAPAVPTTTFAPVDATEANGASAGDSSATTTPQPDVPTPLSERPSSSASAGRPIPPARSASYMADGWKTSAAAAADVGSSSTGSSRSFAGQGQDNAQRTTRAASDGAILSTASAFASLTAPAAAGEPGSRAAGGTSSRLSSLGSSSNDDGAADEQAFYREHQRRSLVDSASQRLSSTASKSAFSPPLASARLAPGSAPFFAPPVFVPAAQQQQQQAQRESSSAAVTPSSSSFPTSSSALLSPTSTSPPSSAFSGEGGAAGPPGSKGATLHLGDLDVWMDEAYVRECCALMGWDAVSAIKMSRGASPASGYCFLTFPTTADAQRALQRFNSQPPMLMPRSGRTFKLNWGTGLPGLQPRWDGEFSVFVGDLAREVGEADLMTLFTPLFPSTKSAKVMCDPSTGLSRGYGFVRFTDESDMARALRVGANAHSGLLLHGRTIRISEASGPGSSAAAHAPPNAVEGMSHLRERTRTRSGEGHFAAQQQQQQSGQQQSGQQSGQQQQQQAPPQAQGYFPPYPTTPLAEQPFPDHHAYASPALASTPYGHPSSSSNGGAAASYPSPLSPYGGPPPALGGGVGAQSMASPGLPRAGARDSSTPQVRAPIPQGAVPPGGDPNNTTVFVGGLPACISEETLKSFFHHFGEITYCKIPPGKGCGFVQFVRRQDAELAIAKMNDFPIHGKSRIRLSWGRSQGDKQVEHVRKLASALGVPFDAVWRMVQGQDNSTIKQIASAVGTNGSSSSTTGGSSPPQQHQQQSRSVEASLTSRMDLRAVANAAGLSESEVLDLVKNGNGFLAAHPLPNHSLNGNGGGNSGAGNNGNANGGSSHSNSTAGSDFFARSSAVTGSATSLESNAAGASGSSPSSGAEGGAPRGPGGQNPYSRVSPSSFSSAFGAQQQQQGSVNQQQQQQQHGGGMFPMSPPPTAGPANGGSSFAHHQSQHSAYAPPPQSMPVGMHHSPYTAIRPESYLVQPPTQSPYERVDFADGGRPASNGFMPGPPSQQQHLHQHAQHQHQHGLPHGGHGGPDRYQPQGFGFPGPGGANAGKWHEQPHVYDGSGGHYGHHGGSSLDDSFSSLHLGGGGQGQGNNGGALVGSPPGRSLPPPVNANARHAFTPTAPDFFPGALASPTTQGAGLPGGSSVGEANWSWGGVSAA